MSFFGVRDGELISIAPHKTNSKKESALIHKCIGLDIQKFGSASIRPTGSLNWVTLNSTRGRPSVILFKTKQFMVALYEFNMDEMFTHTAR